MDGKDGGSITEDVRFTWKWHMKALDIIPITLSTGSLSKYVLASP